MNVLFNLRNKDYQTRVILLEYIRRELSTGKYYAGRYSDPIDNANEYFRLDQSAIQAWYLVPQDLFDNMIKQTFKRRDGSQIELLINKMVYLQEDAHTDNPTYYSMSLQSVKFNKNSIVNYNVSKKRLYKVRKTNSLNGFMKITNRIGGNETSFDFSEIDLLAEKDQHI